MASDLSSGCTDDINIFEEKEEGEISLEDVSSSEESHPNYRSGFRTAGRCTSCMSLQMCAPWCTAARAARKSLKKQDAAHGKENRLHTKDPSSTVAKHTVMTLQEKNDDLVPISSDSDMEIVGLPGNSKQLHARSKSTKVRKKKKKKRSHSSVVRIEDALSPTQVETYLVDVPTVKKVRTPRSHHRESSPPRYSVRSPLERPPARNPSRRYRATRPLKSRSPLRRSRSPTTRANVADRKSPRKVRSPRRSPATRSPVKSSQFRDAREHASPSSQAYVDVYATKLLKKVRRLESVGSGSTKNLSKSKEHSSLKEKLSNMMKNQTEESHEKPSSRKRNNTNIVNNNNNNNDGAAAAAEADDEDNIELLRRLALETKQKKSENKIEESKVNESDDNDIEANELRIVALRSAIMNKHQKRVTRGVKSKKLVKLETRVESPFNESFLDDFQLSGEEESSVKSLTMKSSPILDDESNHPEDMDSNNLEDTESNHPEDMESNHPEDMDLDTDVEREKEKDFMPYSPTDDLTREIVEAELPEANDNNNEEEKLFLTLGEENARDEQHISPGGSDYLAGVDTPYSPSAPTETPNLNKLLSHRPANNENEKIAPEKTENPSSPERSDCTSEKSLSYYLPGVDTPYSPPATMMTLKAREFLSQTKNNTNTESRPYSPTDTPILDPELFPIFPNLPAIPQEIEIIGINEDEKNSASEQEGVDCMIVENIDTTLLDESIKEVVEVSTDSEIILLPQEDEKSETPMITADVTVVPLREDSFEPIGTIDKLPEVDLDGSPLVPLSNELENTELVVPIEISPEIFDTASEPFYLQCLSDVTKDTNKIPTLVNRTLVPVPILKTNKQLQQPLPQKKLDNHAEPSFKSAEMRPVSVEMAPVKPTTSFKPIKLCPIPKKPQVMTTAAAAFNTSFADDLVKETKSDDEPAIVEVPAPVKEANTTTIKSPASGKSQKMDEESEQKKKANGKNKRRRERFRDRRKASAVAESPNCAKESNSNRARSGESNSSNLSGKKIRSEVGRASNANERVTRASSKFSLPKCSENFNEIVQKGSVHKSTESDASPAKSDKPTPSKKGIGELGGRKRRTPRKKRRSSKKVKRLSNNSTVTRMESSNLDVTKNIEERANKIRDKGQKEPNKNEGDSGKAREESKKADEVERKRRCSMDEDEEALRALLLASLPKRTKPVEAGQSTPPTNPVAKVSQLSDATMDTSVENSTNKVTTESTACLAHSAFTPVNPLILSSQSSNANSVTQAKVEGLGAATRNSEVARKILASESNSSGVESSPLMPRKRTNSMIIKGPPKKIVKKALPVLASTKVVNNAKKYQNALLQKKLNLQRAAVTYGAQNGSRNITLNNLKNNDAARPSSPKITTASKMQRLVINLGSDTDSEADLESQPSNSISGDVQTEVRKPLTIPTTDFEKSVVQFLKDQRKKLESGAVSKPPTSTTTTTNKTVANFATTATEKNSGLYNTPLAVRRHLPMSQQEEYRRLKQQIMERERQKLQKTVENGSTSQNSSLKSPCTPPGPLSPASPIAATQKSQINQKVSSVVTQVTTSTLAPSSKDKSLENPVVQKKINLVKANENLPAKNVTKVSKTIVPAIPNKLQIQPLTASSKVNSNIPSIPSSALTSNAPIKAFPKANPNIPNANIPAITSTPKVQSSISSKTQSSTSSEVSLPLAKGAALTTENREKFDGEVPSTSTKFSVEPSTSVSTRGKARWSLGTMSVPPLPATRITSVGRSSLNPTEMLTIQIPNDKVQTERVASTGISKEESSSPPNGRNVGMLRILTKEQLNNKFVKIQVKQGPTGRTVTVGGSSLSQDDAAQSASSSPTPKLLPESRSDKSDKTICCDSSLIVNESTATKRGEKRAGESMVVDSEASTLVLSRSEGNIQNDTTVDSAASTFVLVHDNSESRESPGMAKTEESEDGALATNARGAKETKVQVKEVWEKIRSDVKNELEILTALPADQQRIILTESEENLVAKRDMVLEDLTEMSSCLRQWEVEREIQTKLIAEVNRLREQLRTAEKRLHEQRRQMNSMGPKVTKAHEKINHGRRECYKLSRICHGLGSKIIGEDYKVPDTDAQLLNERLKEVAVHTRQLSKKKVPHIDSLSDSRDTNSPASSTGSDTVSEISFVERPSNSTAPLSETNIGETTNSLTSETNLDDTRVTRDNYKPPEISIADSPCPNSVSERADVLTEEEEDSSEAHAPSTETRVEAKEDPQTKDEEGSSSSETNAQTIEADSVSSEINAQTKEKEASSSSECNTNENSEIPATNLINEDRVEDISVPSTSKFHPHGQLLLSDEQPPVKTKIDPYKSVLSHLKSSRSVNPDGILCPYELMGTCSDGDCQFYHLDPAHCQ